MSSADQKFTQSVKDAYGHWAQGGAGGGGVRAVTSNVYVQGDLPLIWDTFSPLLDCELMILCIVFGKKFPDSIKYSFLS